MHTVEYESGEEYDKVNDDEYLLTVTTEEPEYIDSVDNGLLQENLRNSGSQRDPSQVSIRLTCSMIHT